MTSKTIVVLLLLFMLLILPKGIGIISILFGLSFVFLLPLKKFFAILLDDRENTEKRISGKVIISATVCFFLLLTTWYGIAAIAPPTIVTLLLVCQGIHLSFGLVRLLIEMGR